MRLDEIPVDRTVHPQGVILTNTKIPRFLGAATGYLRAL